MAVTMVTALVHDDCAIAIVTHAFVVAMVTTVAMATSHSNTMTSYVVY